MSYVRAGATFLWSGPDLPGRHLWITLTNPDPSTNKVAAVMVVTKRGHTDPTVILAKGDHPFIEHETSVDYGSAKLVGADRLAADMRAGTCAPQANLGQGVLKRVRDGLILSERTANYLKEHCEALFR